MLKYKDYTLLESAPRIPNDINYWKRKGKQGKNVCIIFHDDMDGVVSAIIMKEWLLNKGFDVVKYALINYQESWDALELDPKLINIALDFAEDAPDVDVYMDHHGSFEEEVRLKQQRPAVKTHTGSAAEGIALQLGVPFGKETKNWIDMIDSAKYKHYEVDIRDILNFNLKEIAKDTNSKMRFASAFNQLLKRSEFKTFIEVVNAAKGPSIYNIFRLFKIFFPKNNPNWKSGSEAEFVDDAAIRLDTMQTKTRGKGGPEKVHYLDKKDFWNDFSKKMKFTDKDGKDMWKLQPGSYQLIGNIMFVPSGTWANALRAKAIFVADRDNGLVPDDPKLNFTMLQYGNTLQIADLDTRVEDMKDEDLPLLKNGKRISNLGKYMDGLVKNFQTHLDYHDERTVSGGHYGIGTISNIFGKCTVKPYVGIKFLDMFKNKVINDMSGVEWSLGMPWNDSEGVPTVKEEDINVRMLGKDEIRSEADAMQEKKERRFLSWVVLKNEWDKVSAADFKIPSMKKIYSFLKKNVSSLMYGDMFNPTSMQKLWFKDREKDELSMDRLSNDLYTSGVFDDLITHFGYDKDDDGKKYKNSDNILYASENSNERKTKRKEAKRLMVMMGLIVSGEYMREDREKFEQEYKKWKKKK
jgi:hypothetical protein